MLSMHLTCSSLAVANLIFHSSVAGEIGSRLVTIFLLCLCSNQLPVSRSGYFSFKFLLNTRYDMHQSWESRSSCNVKRRSTCLLTRRDFNLQKGSSGTGSRGSLRHMKEIQNQVEGKLQISNFWCWEVHPLGARASRETAEFAFTWDILTRCRCRFYGRGVAVCLFLCGFFPIRVL